MAKKIAHNYTFTPSTDTLVIDGYVPQKSLLLVTNVTRGIIIYNFADPALGALSVSYSSSTDKTTVVLEYDCAAMSSTDQLQIFVEKVSQEIEPVEMLYDPVNKFRVSQPQALIDTDFEYGTQITKWENLATVNNRPGSYFSQVGISTISSITMTPGGNVVTVNLVNNAFDTNRSGRPGIGTVISVQDTNLPFANGNFVVDTTPSSTQFTYKTRTVNTTSVSSLFDSNKTGIFSGTPYSNTNLGVAGIVTSAGYAVTVSTTQAHGLSLGNQVTIVGSAATIMNGGFTVISIGGTNNFTYYAAQPPVGVTTNSSQCFVRPTGTALHRAFDGGVIFSTNTGSNYESMARQTRRYFRYQSGKGIQVSSGTVIKPNIVIDSVTSSGTTVTVITRELHNIQRVVPGTVITVTGCNESAYNGVFTVIDVLAPNKFTYSALSTPSSPVASGTPTIAVSSWYGAKNRLGVFDQQNGLFFEFDGQNLNVVRRSSTTQISGKASVVNGSSVVTRTTSEYPTYFSKNLSINDFVVIRGQSYRVRNVDSDTTFTISPAYRGTTADYVTISKTIDYKIPQSEWNLDKCDGTGPSGYNMDLTKMQMFYIDYSWYGAGFIRWGVRGTGGNVIYCHKLANNNVNTEAYMRSGNLPARYETITEPPSALMTSTLGSTDDRVGVASTAGFPSSGTVVIRNSNLVEYANYVGVGTTALLNLVRAKAGSVSGLAVTATIGSSLISVNAGAGATATLQVGQRLVNFGFPEGTFITDIGIGGTIAITGAATTNLSGVAVTFAPMGATSAQTFTYSDTDETIVELAYPTYAPTISHWGTSVIMDGRYDDDKSLVFTYGTTAATSIPINSSRAIFSIRVAPSVDNALTGAFGQREIQNRMQLTLRALDVTAITQQSAQANLLVRGYLNGVVSSATLWTNSVNNIPGQANSSLAQIADYSGGTTTINNGEVITGFFVGSGANSVDLSQVRDLGNSIQGGGGTTANTGIYPDGPDVFTIVVTNLNTVGAGTTVFARLSWTEAQA